jgi:glycosyltransferase involved in cell wall biosynthesis
VPEVHFAIAGRDTYADDTAVSFEGPDRLSFKSLLVEKLPKHCRDRVHFLGYVPAENLPQYLYHAGVFVAPSLYESFGLVYIEAMAYAKPVVGCRVGGVPEVVDHGKTGLLVEPDNPEALADAVACLLLDSDRAARMGTAGRSTVEDKFTSNRMAENTVVAYQAAIAERRG